MMPTHLNNQALVPPPSYHRAQTRQSPALYIDALTLVSTLHLHALCRLAVRLAQRCCPPPLPSLVPRGVFVVDRAGASAMATLVSRYA